jgi:Rieske Fe-S protein
MLPPLRCIAGHAITEEKEERKRRNRREREKGKSRKVKESPKLSTICTHLLSQYKWKS